MKRITLVLLPLFLGLAGAAQTDTLQKIDFDRRNAPLQQQKPYVILISIDGLRWDLVDKYEAKNLIRLRSGGVQADYLKPSFPSLTFPNHYTLITGLYPAHHGLVDNTFYDRGRSTVYKRTDKKVALDDYWYRGKPLWVLAEEQKMLSAVFYWPGSEVAIAGIKPTYYYEYNETIPVDQRVAIVKQWFELPEERRPHFMALYFPQVDKAGHRYTAESAETQAAVLDLDAAVGKIVAVAEQTGLPVNFVVLSDHGMTTINREETISLPKYLQQDQFIVPPGNALLQVYATNKKDIKSTFRALKAEAKDFEVYLTKKTPKSWNYSKREDRHNRIGDLILIPHLPKVFSINGVKPDPAQHGFDPAIRDMHAVFYAWGPQIRHGLKIPAFENIHVYPFIAQLLGLKVTAKIDGDAKVLAQVLK